MAKGKIGGRARADFDMTIVSKSGISILAMLAALSGQVAAQPADAGNDAENEVLVTGSRIRVNPLERAQPVLDIDAEALQRSGVPTVGDYLQRLPSSGGGLNSRTNSSGNFGNPPDGGGVGAGSQEIDLRYLGSRRVLVLVDGLRWVNGSSASGVPGSTDLNTIPAASIERIEVLQDGASPIYGSDAIAGVVNVITKRKQDGFAASAQLGAYGRPDGESQDYQVSFGASNDRTDVFFAVNYFHQNGVSSNDRDISRFPVPYLGQCYVTCSSATPRGRFIFTDPNTSQTLSLTLRNGFSYSGANPVYNPAAPTTSGDFQRFTTADRFDFQPFNYVVTPSERIGFFSQVTHDVTDDIKFRGKAVFNNRESQNQAAPIPIFIGPDAGNGNRLDTTSVDVTNPFNPFGFSLTPANTAFIARRLFEAGPRQYDQSVDTYYLSGSFEGEFAIANRTVYWDANGLWSRNKANQLAYGIVNSARLARALGPISQCTGECVPFNFFGGPGSVTQAMVNYITFVQHDSSEQEIWDASFNVSTELFNLPAGAVGFAGGYEHRDQSGQFDPDPIVAAGDSADIPALPTRGRYDVEDLYGELKIPLLKNAPFARALDADFAIRRSSYSTGPKETTIKAGARWRPTADLTLRGGYTEGFRAATIGELFGSASRFDATLNDPCSNINAASATTRANCIALGVPSNGSYVQTNFQISTTTGGNAALLPETSKGWNAGMVYAPAALERYGALFEVNFYDIKVDNAIQALDSQLQLNNCVATLDPVICAPIRRSASGTIVQFNNTLTNIGGVKTRGLDGRIAFSTPEGPAGRFSFETLATYLLKYTEISPTATGFQSIDRQGTLRGSPTFSWPRFKATSTLAWSLREFRAQAVGRFISSVTEGCPDPFSSLPSTGSSCSRPDPADDSLSANDLAKIFYLDIAASWRPSILSSRTELTVGVNNITNAGPPACFTCQLNGFDPNTYDAPGRYGYVRITWRP